MSVELTEEEILTSPLQDTDMNGAIAWYFADVPPTFFEDRYEVLAPFEARSGHYYVTSANASTQHQRHNFYFRYLVPFDFPEFDDPSELVSITLRARIHIYLEYINGQNSLSRNPSLRIEFNWTPPTSPFDPAFQRQFSSLDEFPFDYAGVQPIAGLPVWPEDGGSEPLVDIEVPLELPPTGIRPGDLLSLRWRTLPFPMQAGSQSGSSDSFEDVSIYLFHDEPAPVLVLRWGEEEEEEILKPFIQRRAKRMRDRYQAMTGTLTGRRR